MSTVSPEGTGGGRDARRPDDPHGNGAADGAASLAEAVRAVVPGVMMARVQSLPHAGGFRLGLEGGCGEADLSMRGSTLSVEHPAMLLPPGRDEDEDRLDPRLLAIARAMLDWARPRGASRLLVTSHWCHKHETRAWVRVGALPVAGGSRMMDAAISFNLNAVARVGAHPEDGPLALAGRLRWKLDWEPHLLRALAALPEPMRLRWGPTLGHAALNGATWPVEIDLAEPSTAAIFAAACGEVPKAVGRQAYRDSGHEAMVREGFTPDDVRMAWGR